MPLSAEAQRASLASQGDIAIQQLLKLEGPDVDTIHLASGKRDIEKDGTTYQRFALKIKPLNRDSDSVPKIEIEVGNVDHRVIEAMMQLRGKRDVMITYIEVQEDDPDKELFRARFEYDKLTTDGATSATITATFLRGALDESYPAGRISPTNASKR